LEGILLLEINLTIIMLIALTVSTFYLVYQRRRKGITGFKTALTSICFYSIAIINLVAIWTKSLGIITWLLSILLLFLAAYFTKFFPQKRQQT